MPEPTLLAWLLLAVVGLIWAGTLSRRSKVTGDEEVLLDIASPPLSDWLVLVLCVAAAIGLLVLLGDSRASVLFPLALVLTGVLMFVDNLPAAITSRGLRRGLSITPWSEFAGWHWDATQPHTLVLDGSAGDTDQGLVAVPVTDPQKAAGAPETPTLPSPDDYAEWEQFRGVIEMAMAKHLPVAAPAAGGQGTGAGAQGA